jgi:DICT domain-containing protein/nitrogen-specific signal transduction histidine kinase
MDRSISNPNSVLADLLKAMPHLRAQLYFKPSLTALSHAMEDQVLAGSEQLLVIANFQRERFYRQEAHRYQRIAERTPQVYVLAAPETEFKSASHDCETVAFDPQDGLSQEWHLVVIGQQYGACLICREKLAPEEAKVKKKPGRSPNKAANTCGVAEIDTARRFEGIWTFDRQVASVAADLLLERILSYRPELADKIQQARSDCGIVSLAPKRKSSAQKMGPNSVKIEAGLTQHSTLNTSPSTIPNPGAFAQRLLTYVQAGQYKLLKAYRSIAAQEQKERLINSITDTIRRSLDPDEILQVAVKELGQELAACRCPIYCCQATDATATISYEFLQSGARSAGIACTLGQIWPLQDNPLFQQVVKQREPLYVADTQTDPQIAQSSTLQKLVQKFSINSWLMVPVLYQDQLLGMVELHHCGASPRQLTTEDLSLMSAIATQIGVALIQAQAYARVENLNQQLAALDRTRANLIAITGHELRTPLSTIQVCLESLANEPDMATELRQLMLDTALADAERLRKLIQDFLTLSRLESGRVEWHFEPIDLTECAELAISSIRTHRTQEQQPPIVLEFPADLPLVKADGEWLVEVIIKLLDNACKFTPAEGRVSVMAQNSGSGTIQVTVADTGRGIASERLETVFDRFYQEEGALRRSTGGTGLGLAICRQIVSNWGGTIWAESAGKNQGSQFHFTVPVFEG